MKKLTNEEKMLLKHVVTELKALIVPDYDYEGASIQGMLNGYLEAKCNPIVSMEIKEKTVYHCGTAKDAVAFLAECEAQGIFLITNGRSLFSCYTAMLKFDKTVVDEPLDSADFLLTSSGDKVRMGTNLKDRVENLAVINFKANKEAR